MPRAPKACGKDGCETRVTGRTYCEPHTPINWAKTRNPRTGSTQHKAWRRAVLDRDHWQCQIRGPHCTRKATQADHIINVKTSPHLEFEMSNGQGVCAECHAEKTQIEAQAARRRAYG